ncbi:MAG: WD40 repeat domain-containing protein, partial [Thermomicrobiales bacterium]
FNPAFSADGQTLYFISKNRNQNERPQLAAGDLYSIRIASLDGERRFDNLTMGAVPDIWSVAPAPIGRRILLYSLYSESWYESPRTSIRLLDPASGESIAVSDDLTLMGAPVWSPDGSRFAWTENDHTICITGGKTTRTIESRYQLSNAITWSPDGARLIAAALMSEEPSLLVDTSPEQPLGTEISLAYDAATPYYGPPQWAPLVAPIDPNRFGAGLDSSE